MDYRQFVLPYVQQIVAGLHAGVPVINFATGNPALLPLLAEGGAPVIGIDWRIDLDEGWRRVGFERAVQGNLDPCVLLADRRRYVSVLKMCWTRLLAGRGTFLIWGTASSRKHRSTM